MALDARHFVAAGVALTLGAQSQDVNATPENGVDQQGVVTMYEMGQKPGDEFATIGVRTQIKDNIQISQDVKDLPFGGETPQVGMICGYRIVLTNGVDGVAEGCLMVLDKDGKEIQKLTAADYPFIGEIEGLQVEDGGASNAGLVAILGADGKVQFFTFDKSSSKPLSPGNTVEIPFQDGEKAHRGISLAGNYYVITDEGRIITIDGDSGDSSISDSKIPQEFNDAEVFALPNFPGVAGGAIVLTPSAHPEKEGKVHVYDPKDFSNPILVVSMGVGGGNVGHVKVDPSGKFLVVDFKIIDLQNPSNTTDADIGGDFTFRKNEAGQTVIISRHGTVTITNENPLTTTFVTPQGEMKSMTSGGVKFVVNDSDNDGYDDEADPSPYDPNLPKAATVTPPVEEDTGGKDGDTNGNTDTDSGKPSVVENPKTEPDAAGTDAGGSGEPKPNPNPVTGKPDQPGTSGADAGPSISADTGSGGACDASERPISPEGFLALGLAGGVVLAARRKWAQIIDWVRSSVSSSK